MRILDYMERLQTLTRLLKKEHTGSAYANGAGIWECIVLPSIIT